MHLEGSVEPETLMALAQRNDVRMPYADAVALRRANGFRVREVGLCITVNSDDPPYFGGYVNENFAAIQEAPGFSGDEPLAARARWLRQRVRRETADRVRWRDATTMLDYRRTLRTAP
jgi:adenosine deaminase